MISRHKNGYPQSKTAKKDTSIMSSHIEFLVWHNLTQIKNDFPKIYGMPKSLGGLYQIYSFFMTHMSSLRAGITSKSTAESSFSVQTVFLKKKNEIGIIILIFRQTQQEKKGDTVYHTISPWYSQFILQQANIIDVENPPFSEHETMIFPRLC